MKKKIIRKRITLNELKRYKTITCLNKGDGESSTMSFIVKDPKTNKNILIIRRGECQPKKCKGACCKFCMVSDGNTYWKNFGEKTKNGQKFKGNCKQLNCKSNTCKLWGKKSFPEACKNFPVYTDSTYWEVFNECSFYYEKVYEVRDLNE